jgi:hypothetical protein
VTEGQLLAVLGEQAGVPFIHIGNRVIARAIMQLVPEKLMRRRNVLPLAAPADLGPRQLLVATSTPMDLFLLDEIAFAAGMRVKPVMALDGDIAQAVERHLRMAPRS